MMNLPRRVPWNILFLNYACLLRQVLAVGLTGNMLKLLGNRLLISCPILVAREPFWRWFRKHTMREKPSEFEFIEVDFKGNSLWFLGGWDCWLPPNLPALKNGLFLPMSARNGILAWGGQTRTRLCDPVFPLDANSGICVCLSSPYPQ